MESIYLFILRYDVIIYILCGFGLFWYISQYVRAQRILRRAVFGLEFETGRHIRNNALIFTLALAGTLGFTIYVNTNIAPTLPPELLRPPTPTPGIFSTRLAPPTPLGTPAGQLSQPTPLLAATITLPGQAEGNSSAPSNNDSTTPEPTGLPPTPIIGCTIVLNISDPRDGATVSGTISFFGTADIQNFQFYLLEANGPQTNGQWASLLGRNIDQTVQNGLLGRANLSQWAAGPYLIRLTAVDTNEHEIGHCVIQITLDNR